MSAGGRGVYRTEITGHGNPLRTRQHQGPLPLGRHPPGARPATQPSASHPGPTRNP